MKLNATEIKKYFYITVEAIDEIWYNDVIEVDKDFFINVFNKVKDLATKVERSDEKIKIKHARDCVKTIKFKWNELDLGSLIICRIPIYDNSQIKTIVYKYYLRLYASPLILLLIISER